MKKNFFLSMCGFLMILAFSSCNDGNVLGMSIQPDKDKISVAYDTVHVNTKTVFIDSVYLRNSVAMLGEFTDPTFGTTKSDFMAQLYCARNFAFPDDVKQIDSAYIYFYYDDWFGDSTAVNHLNVYELSNNLNINSTYYSNTEVAKYCDKKNLIAEGAFTTGDLYTSDSARALSTYKTAVRIPVSLTLAKRFLDDSRSNPKNFATPEAFRNYFKGIYATTDYGNGSILNVTHSEIEMCFLTYLYSASGVRDSMVVGACYFPVTQEVKQINRVEHPDSAYYYPLTKSDSLNYIYAPAGMFTKVTVPERIFTKNTGLLSGKTISSLRLKVLATQLDDEWDYAMSPPKTLLLLNAADADAFFKDYKLNDGINAFLATYDSSNEQYLFDLSGYAQNMIHTIDGSQGTVTAGFKPFTDMIIIPISVVQNADGENIRINHVMSPAAVKIRGGKHPTEPMMLEVLYAKKNN